MAIKPEVVALIAETLRETSTELNKMFSKRDQFQSAMALQNLILSHVTNGHEQEIEYINLRKKCLSFGIPNHLIPKVVFLNHNLSQLKSEIRKGRPTYQERREYIWGEFKPLFVHIEGLGDQSPISSQAATAIQIIDSDHINTLWQKALSRSSHDPEGTITLSRTILESTCKHILDKCGVEYVHTADLPELYKATAKTLNLSPEQHTEQIFKQILGGVNSVVLGLGSLRNKHSDSHGPSSKSVRPAARHARLAINLGMSTAIFLIETFENMSKLAVKGETSESENG